MLPRVFELLREALGYPSVTSSLSMHAEKTVLDLISFALGLLPFLTEYTLLHSLVDVEQPNFQYLLQIISLPLVGSGTVGSPSSPSSISSQSDTGERFLFLWARLT